MDWIMNTFSGILMALLRRRGRRGMERLETSIATKGTGSNQVLRFRRSEILIHWSIAAPFLVCYASALVLMIFYNPNPLRPLREVFSWIHRIFGLCLIILPLLVLACSGAQWKIHIGNIRKAWVWTLDDVKWLLRIGLSSFSKKVSLPEEGKFNAGEKLNFMMVMTTYPIFILTGILIWLPGVAFYPWLIHVCLAFAVTPLMLGHIFMALINPGTRKGITGMITGLVDRTWARHHYRAWYREQFEGKAVAEEAAPESGKTQAVRKAPPGKRRIKDEHREAMTS